MSTAANHVLNQARLTGIGLLFLGLLLNAELCASLRGTTQKSALRQGPSDSSPLEYPDHLTARRAIDVGNGPKPANEPLDDSDVDTQSSPSSTPDGTNTIAKADAVPPRTNKQSLRSHRQLLCNNWFVGGFPAHPNFPLTPDTNAYYVWTSFANNWMSPLKNVAFQIKHSFPASRFLSVFLYDLGTGVTIDGLVDHQIIPDSNDQFDNPFTVDGEGHNVSSSATQDYTIWIGPTASSKNQIRQNVLKNQEDIGATGLGNFITFESAPSSSLILIVRLYLPDADPADFPSFMKFPRLEAFNLKTGAVRSCPFLATTPPTSLITGIMRGSVPHIEDNHLPNNQVGFYRMQPASIFADDSGDSAYLGTVLDFNRNDTGIWASATSPLSYQDGAVLLRMRLPRFTPVPLSPSSTDQVRYTSICSAGPNALSRVGDCLSDRQMLEHSVVETTEEGETVHVATVLLAQNVTRLAQAARSMNASMLELFGGDEQPLSGSAWQQGNTLFIIRQKIIADHFRPRSFQAVPVSTSIFGSDPAGHDTTIEACPETLCEAGPYLGGWAPQARYCTSQEVLTGTCTF